MKKQSFFLFVLIFALLLSSWGLAAEAADLPKNTIILEAEATAQQNGDVQVLPAEGASGQAINCARGAKASYDVELPNAGEWYVWVRMFCPNGDADSCWVGMDKADPMPADTAINEKALKIYSDKGDSVNEHSSQRVWYWDTNAAHNDLPSYFIVYKAGKVRLWIKGRETGTLVDQILLTMDKEFNPEVTFKGGIIKAGSYNLVADPKKAEIPRITGLVRPTSSVTWDKCLEMKAEWYGTDEAKRIGNNLLLYQRDSGGWPDKIDMALVLFKEEIPFLFKDKNEQDATTENGATIAQLRFLARVYNATLCERYRDGFAKGLEFLLTPENNNDNVIQFLREIKADPEYGFLSKNQKAKVKLAIKKGIGYQAPVKTVSADKLKKTKGYDLIVAQDGSGDFKTVQGAIDSVPKNKGQRVVIFIKKGVYKEKIQLNKNLISLIGEDRDQTILTYNDFAKKNGPYGYEMGTSATPTLSINGNDVLVENLTIENSAGTGLIYGQAVAVSTNGDRLVFRNCAMLAYQDTLLTGGIGRQYYENCLIKGDVDFIFGSATAVFNKCRIYSINRGEDPNGYLTAASTSPIQKYGYVFIDCKLETGAAAPQSVFLGRPWEGFAAVAYINCWMGPHIKAEGWDNWNKPKYETTARYAEYGSSGPGGSMEKRVKWAKQLTAAEAKEYTVEKILAGEDGWNPKQP